jgi:hypothetical protein
MNFKDVEPWAIVSKKAFWDRDVELDVWRKRASACHPSYLPDAVKYMSAPEFIVHYGIPTYKLDWPRLRAHLLASNKTPPFGFGLFDLFWGLLINGAKYMRPVEDFYSMPPRKRQLYTAIGTDFGGSIYAYAKRLGMQYKLCFEYAKELQQEGKIRQEKSISNGRRVTRLLPTTGPFLPCKQHLRKLGQVKKVHQ